MKKNASNVAKQATGQAPSKSARINGQSAVINNNAQSEKESEREAARLLRPETFPLRWISDDGLAESIKKDFATFLMPYMEKYYMWLQCHEGQTLSLSTTYAVQYPESRLFGQDGKAFNLIDYTDCTQAANNETITDSDGEKKQSPKALLSMVDFAKYVSSVRCRAARICKDTENLRPVSITKKALQTQNETLQAKNDILQRKADLLAMCAASGNTALLLEISQMETITEAQFTELAQQAQAQK